MATEMEKWMGIIAKMGKSGAPAASPGKPDGPWARELVKLIAMDIGKDVVHHIAIMYPQAIAACPSTFKLSVRNHIYNEIMAAIDVNDEGQITARLKDRKTHRREVSRIYSKIRTKK